MDGGRVKCGFSLGSCCGSYMKTIPLVGANFLTHRMWFLNKWDVFLICMGCINLRTLILYSVTNSFMETYCMSQSSDRIKLSEELLQ